MVDRAVVERRDERRRYPAEVLSERHVHHSRGLPLSGDGRGNLGSGRRGVGTKPRAARRGGMTDRYRLASRDTIEADGSWLFTGRNEIGRAHV